MVQTVKNLARPAAARRACLGHLLVWVRSLQLL
jgi:hypothetical protein